MGVLLQFPTAPSLSAPLSASLFWCLESYRIRVVSIIGLTQHKANTGYIFCGSYHRYFHVRDKTLQEQQPPPRRQSPWELGAPNRALQQRIFPPTVQHTVGAASARDWRPQASRRCSQGWQSLPTLPPPPRRLSAQSRRGAALQQMILSTNGATHCRSSFSSRLEAAGLPAGLPRPPPPRHFSFKFPAPTPIPFDVLHTVQA